MSLSLLEDNKFALQFAGHETFPLRHGWLKKAFDAVAATSPEIPPKESRTAFGGDEAIADFGVGRNMVASIKHWALATRILEPDPISSERSPRLIPTRLGKVMMGPQGDPFLEHPASLWLIHWNLASTPGRATTWYWAFNEFNEPHFDREFLWRHILRRCLTLREEGKGRGSKISEATIRRDVDCFLRTYVSHHSVDRTAEEDGIDCPLTELSLVKSLGMGGVFQFHRGPKVTLPDEVFLFALQDFWAGHYLSRREFSIELLTHAPGSPGRVFVLDEESVAEYLIRLSSIKSNGLHWDESTGMRQVYLESLQKVNPIKQIGKLYKRDLQRRAG